MRNDSPDLPTLRTASAVELMWSALENPPGLKLRTVSHDGALALRRQIYGVRRRARAKGDESFDGLSVLVSGCELMLVVREFTLGRRVDALERVSLLHPADLPAWIGARGSKRLGLLDSVALLNELRIAAKD